MKPAAAPKNPRSSNPKPVLAIDFDDTLTVNAPHVIEAYNRQHNAKISLNDVYVVGTLGNPKHGWLHDADEALTWIRNFLLSDEGLAISPDLSTVESLQRLQERYDLVVVTGRTEEWAAETRGWIDRHFPDLFSGVYFSGIRSKPELCEQVDAQIMIDDNPYDLGFCVDSGIEAILFGYYPWNRDELVKHSMRRARNWSEVERLLLP